MRFLLDTATCIDVLRDVDPVVDRLRRQAPDDCAVSTVTTYELLTGARKCRRPEREAAKVATFLEMVHEVVLTHEDASYSASICADLERQGLKIGPYDLLLAGQAVARSMTLVTLNTEEFNRVPGIALDDWGIVGD